MHVNALCTIFLDSRVNVNCGPYSAYPIWSVNEVGSGEELILPRVVRPQINPTFSEMSPEYADRLLFRQPN